jgi:hypothetical protein
VAKPFYLPQHFPYHHHCFSSAIQWTR